MNILHITDFHFSKETSLQVNVINAIINTISELEKSIDFVFFTGDLVQTGANIDSFRKAKTCLLDTISKKLNIPLENILLCPGNHDIDRAVIHSAAKIFFDTEINTNTKLNALYNNKRDSMYIDSLKPSLNYNQFLKELHPEGEFNLHKDLYSIHFRDVEGKKVGIACLNSAWICALDKQGREDKGNLLIPIDLLNDIKKSIGSVDKKIILIHHPLYFLKEFNFYEIENVIHSDFDLMFSGHVHKISSVSRHSGTNGIFEHVAKASLSSKENLGCSLIEIDKVEENKIYVNELTYIEDDNKCHCGESVAHTIPCGIEKSKAIAFRKKIFDKINIEKENANNLLLINEKENNNDFLLLYNNPVLKKESDKSLESKNSPAIKFEDISNTKNNYIILGKDKCGKTSLLKRIQLECLINFSKNEKIPFLFDAKEFEKKLDDTFQLELILRNYFEVTKNKIEGILDSDNLVLLIDNYSPKSSMADYLNNFFFKYPKVKFIICTEYNLLNSVEIFQLGDLGYDKLYFHDLRRQEIISYTDRRLQNIQNKEEVQDKIIQLCKQLELPLNYWTISLLLLIHEKSSDNYFKNLFSVLDVCIDEILGKKRLLMSRSRISFEQIKTICGELSKHLFLYHELAIYSASSEDIIKIIDRIVVENDRISTSGKDIFNYLVECGILKEKEDGDLYVFRLNGFFEYFLALQMTKDLVFRNDIINDEAKYLAFKNQLEIYSGFRRDDLDFLSTIYQKSKIKLDPIFINYNSDLDQELLIKIKEPQIIEDICRKISIQRTLSSYEKAQLEDITSELTINSDVHLINNINPDNINSELIDRYLSILARVFRNSDEISGNKELKIEIFNSIIDYYCDLGFYIIEEYSNITKTELMREELYDIDNSVEFSLLKFISNFSPFIAQTWLFDGLGHFNLERMIKNEIAKLELNAINNQYRLFVLYFLLLDIDLHSNKGYIDMALKNIKIPILRYAIILKLNYYLAFKAGKNKSIQQYIANKIQEAKLKLDEKSDIGEIQKNLQAKKTLSIQNPNKL